MTCDVAVCHLGPRERTHSQHTCDPCFNRRVLRALPDHLVCLAPRQTNMPVFLSFPIINISSFLQTSADAISFYKTQNLFVPQVLCSLLLSGIILKYIHTSPFPPTLEGLLRGFCILVVSLPLPNRYSGSVKRHLRIAHEQSLRARARQSQRPLTSQILLNMVPVLQRGNISKDRPVLGCREQLFGIRNETGGKVRTEFRREVLYFNKASFFNNSYP